MNSFPDNLYNQVIIISYDVELRALITEKELDYYSRSSFSRLDPGFLARDEDRMFHLRFPDKAVRRLVFGAVLLFQLSVSECLLLTSILLDERSIELVLTTPLTDCKLEARFRYKKEGFRGGTGLGFLPPVNNPP